VHNENTNPPLRPPHPHKHRVALHPQKSGRSTWNFPRLPWHPARSANTIWDCEVEKSLPSNKGREAFLRLLPRLQGLRDSICTSWCCGGSTSFEARGRMMDGEGTCRISVDWGDGFSLRVVRRGSMGGLWAVTYGSWLSLNPLRWGFLAPWHFFSERKIEFSIAGSLKCRP
jgi:hypothetical protein